MHLPVPARVLASHCQAQRLRSQAERPTTKQERGWYRWPRNRRRPGPPHAFCGPCGKEAVAMAVASAWSIWYNVLSTRTRKVSACRCGEKDDARVVCRIGQRVELQSTGLWEGDHSPAQSHSLAGLFLWRMRPDERYGSGLCQKYTRLPIRKGAWVCAR